MRRFFRQLAPWLLLLSLGANLWLGQHLWQRNQRDNLLLWGNVTTRFVQQVHLVHGNLTVPRDAGFATISVPQLETARESLEVIGWLPHYRQRMDDEDRMVIDRFLRYASMSIFRAGREQEQAGRLSPETEQRLDKISDGLYAMMSAGERRNELQRGEHAYNHNAWRAMFHQMAVGLGQIEFVPLPEGT
jgi:hypothetical protein